MFFAEQKFVTINVSIGFDVGILVGDTNLNLLDKNNPLIQTYINLMCEYGFYPQITKPTRVSDNTGTCLDHRNRGWILSQPGPLSWNHL